MADIERWITVNGVHIPIMNGESAARAVGRFIKSKREKSRESVRKGYAAQGYNRKYAEDAELQQRKQLGEYKGNKQFEKQRTIKGEGTKKFKANEAYYRQTQTEEKYRHKADDLMDKVNKTTDEELQNIRDMRARGESNSKIREARALMDLHYNQGSTQRDLLKLEGAYEGQKTYNRYMDNPMKYKLKGATITDYWNGQGKHQYEYEKIRELDNKGEVPKFAQPKVNKLNRFGHRYYRYYNDGDIPRTEFKEYFGEDSYVPSDSRRFRQTFSEGAIKGFHKYLERKADGLIKDAYNSINNGGSKTLKKQYEKYMKDHPSSKISISEFDKWYK